MIYFKDRNDMARVHTFKNEKGDTVYQVTMLEVKPDGTPDVFYLERARKLETVFNILATKGIELVHLYEPSVEDKMIWAMSCI